MTTRRNFIKKTALSVGIVATADIVGKAKTATKIFDTISSNEMIYVLPQLSYGYDALEPHIDKLTMEIHHTKHHQAYVTNLNKAIAEIKDEETITVGGLDNLFSNMDKLSAAIRNNAGGHYNHTLFWTLMKPNGGGQPTGKLAEAIKNSFVSFEEFKKQFTDAAMKRFGSGWAWLIKTKENKLVISSTANQDNPLMNLTEIEIKGQPILALDVWEHAYYLKNQNRRADYINSWWNVVNWDKAEELFVSK